MAPLGRRSRQNTAARAETGSCSKEAGKAHGGKKMSNSTLKYIGKRLVISLITLFFILMVLFLMVKFLPGSPINNEKLSASARAAIEAQYLSLIHI